MPEGPLFGTGFAIFTANVVMDFGDSISRDPVEASERLLRLFRREGEPGEDLLNTEDRVLLPAVGEQAVGDDEPSAKGSMKALCDVPGRNTMIKADKKGMLER